MALLRRLHAAIARPFRRPAVDHDAHREVQERQERIVRRLDRRAELRAQANVHGRKPWRDAGQSWSG
jgi:hypothetical protein